MRLDYFVGIDPGVEGAIAIVSEDGRVVRVYDTPTYKVKVGKVERKRLDLPAISEILGNIRWEAKTSGRQLHWIIEQVGILPNDGKVGAFSFGKGFGEWRGLLTCGGEFTEVRPQDWKRVFGLTGADKGASIEAAQIYGTNVTEEDLLRPTPAGRKTKVSHDRAEAILIAEWGRRRAVQE